MVTFTWHACKHKVHDLHLSPLCFCVDVLCTIKNNSSSKKTATRVYLKRSSIVHFCGCVNYGGTTYQICWTHLLFLFLTFSWAVTYKTQYDPTCTYCWISMQHWIRWPDNLAWKSLQTDALLPSLGFARLVSLSYRGGIHRACVKEGVPLLLLLSLLLLLLVVMSKGLDLSCCLHHHRQHLRTTVGCLTPCPQTETLRLTFSHRVGHECN